MKVHDGVFEYRDALKRTSRCHLRVWKFAAGSVVVSSELPDNPGPSITNSAENLAQEAAETFALNVRETTWVEHYPGEPGAKTEEWNGDHYDLVTYLFARDGQGRVTAASPQWRRLPKAEVERMVKESL